MLEESRAKEFAIRRLLYENIARRRERKRMPKKLLCRIYCINAPRYEIDHNERLV